MAAFDRSLADVVKDCFRTKPISADELVNLYAANAKGGIGPDTTFKNRLPQVLKILADKGYLTPGRGSDDLPVYKATDEGMAKRFNLTQTVRTIT